MKILGANFQRAREELGLTVEEVANQSTLSKKQVLQIETDESAAFEVPGDRYAELDLVAEGSADKGEIGIPMH